MRYIRQDFVKIVSLLMIGMLVTASPANLFAQQANKDNVKEENAAIYYSQAFGLMRYPESEELKDKLLEIVQNGWREEDKELEKILMENEPSFNEFKKGLLLEKCDFTFGKEYKYIFEKEPPPLLKTRNFTNLLLLKGRYYKKQGELEEAINLYLSLLSLAQHISQDNTMVSKMIAIGIERAAYKPLRQYLDSEKAEKEKCLKILNYLTKYEEEYFPAKHLVEIEKEAFLSYTESLRDEAKQKALEDQEFNEEKERAIEALGEEIILQAQVLADRYYGNFAKAVETNDANDWEFAETELDAFIKSQKDVFANMKDISSLLYNAFTRNLKESNNIIARRIISLLLAIAVPNFRGAAENYYLALEELKELKSLAKIKNLLFPRREIFAPFA